MNAKIRNFLQSDVFILAVALILGALCHFFVRTSIIASDEKEKASKAQYATTFSIKPITGIRCKT